MTRQWTVDAFAHAPFSGNPACVVEPMDAWPETAWMQALAMENNQAETAFLRRTADPACFDLRWFTPMQEVRLCGHATLAAAHVLMAELGADAPRLAFDTLSGRLTVERAEAGYQMDFPADPPVQIPVPEGLAEALGAPVLECWAARYLVAIVPDADTVRRLRPDIRGLDRLDCDAASEAGHVIVSALDESGQVDVVDRFFAPGCGVDEDPATGSAHCILGPLYADKLGRDIVRFLQAYPRRGGHIETQTAGDRVLIRGQAVTVMDSRLREG